MKRSQLALAALVLVAGSALHAMAQTPPDHSKMDHSKMGAAKTPNPGGESPSSAAFKAVNDKMHAAMSMPLTGDADIDFVKGMIPHHQGAVEMAKIELQYGKDPELRKLARDVIKAQDKEIAFMQRWLAKKVKN